jgi:hypothetical protein
MTKENRMSFKSGLTFLSALLVVGTASAQDHTHHHMTSDTPSIHGMLIVGTEKVFLSHLPMFHPPHDYQAIVEAEFDAPGLRMFKHAKANSTETIFTLVPEKTFVLPEMISNPTLFFASVYKGHFERGGTFVTKVTVKIVKTIYFQKLDPNGMKPAEEKYLVFGSANEKFQAHIIQSKPSFDEVSQLNSDGTKSQLYFETGDLSF